MNFDGSPDHPHSEPIPPVLQSRPVAKLAAALAKAQGVIPAPVKNRQVDFVNNKGQRVRYSYADLADVIDCVRAALSSNELCIVHRLEYSIAGYGMLTELHHASGESISTWYPLPDPARDEIRAQDFGSALTYARRYSLSALLGIASEEDDDGAEAPPRQPEKPTGKAPVKPKAPETPTEAQLARLFTIAGENKWTKEQIKLYMGARWKIESTKLLTRAQYDSLVDTIEKSTYTKACADLVSQASINK